MTIVDTSDEDADVKAAVQDFTWRIAKVDPLEMQIKIDLANPALFADGDKFVVVKAQFSDFEPGWSDDEALVRVNIPKQKVVTVAPETIAKVESAGETAQVATAATLTLNLVMSGAMAQIWGLINGL